MGWKTVVWVSEGPEKVCARNYNETWRVEEKSRQSWFDRISEVDLQQKEINDS